MERKVKRARWSLASQSNLAEADPTSADVLALKLALGLLDLLLILEEHQREASILAFLLLDDDVLLRHVESAKELDDFLDGGSPGQPTDLGDSVAVLLVNEAVQANNRLRSDLENLG